MLASDERCFVPDAHSDPTAFGPHLFRADAVDPQTALFNAQLAQALTAVPPIYTRPPQATRDDREAGRGAFGPIVLSPMATERSIAGPGGALPLRVFVPDEVKGVYLHIHGGGWVLGRAHHSDVVLEALARACSLAVVSVDYRLAPEYPYPAGPDDCEAAALWLAKNAQAEFGADQLLIGGESAGGHLAAVTMLRLRDRHGANPFLAANLTYGVFDLSETPSQMQSGEKTLVINHAAMKWFGNHFIPAERRRDPDVSPMYAELSGMPPALFTVGTLDPLLDDSLFMYARWIAAGNEAQLAVYPGAVHGFISFPMPLAKRAADRIHAFFQAVTEQVRQPAAV
jgi:acetyl esterase/lipase